MNVYQKVLYATLIISGLTNAVRMISLGPITALGALSIISGIGSWVLVFTRSHISKATYIATSLVLFVVYSLFNFLWYSLTSKLPISDAVQNLSLYLAFVGILVLSAIETNRSFDPPDFISNALSLAGKLSVLVYGFSILIGGFGTGIIMGARPFALFAMIAAAWFLAGWRYGLLGSRWWTIFTIVVMALSFSRTALVVTLILFPLSQISFNSIKGWLKMGFTIFLMVTVSFLAFTYVEPIRSRFTDVGDNATVGGVQINTSGRATAWPIAYASAWESPWIGHGPGSVVVVLVQNVGRAFSHPHNDYLRIFHDYGLIGLTLWLLGYIGLLVKTWQNWQWSDQNDRANARISLAAFLTLVAVAIAMISDNIIVYLFAMNPLGILVGASLGSTSRRKKVIKTARKLELLSDEFEQLVQEA
ncbi:lipid A core-O-antigen ligase-like enyme [Rivularia sp. PCC 7116]|uniref:O-antigen ligase family protein n=1 Tax=Rivularia sp. PCC 7116 TaxID=373994 RepID=UPI00029F33D0|nr:O-antigen ligase family protein [Rivularia sp. PCC 7116]AFY53080.1 lipid A core-O-antigen ligase-like enyme [Rivularia sp. PCC 7116]